MPYYGEPLHELLEDARHQRDAYSKWRSARECFWCGRTDGLVWIAPDELDDHGIFCEQDLLEFLERDRRRWYYHLRSTLIYSYCLECNPSGTMPEGFTQFYP